ncbi:MAG: hypothetical protein NT154_17470, partial [Verrucomicrobia bacterium]|nr:hypothetical protein [Verrucomicrobiota bacterium]
MQTGNPSLADLIDCAARELALRQRVYANWVSQRRMSPGKAQWEIDCMAAILEHLRKDYGEPELGFTVPSLPPSPPEAPRESLQLSRKCPRRLFCLNPKSEARNPKQIQSTNAEMTKTRSQVRRLEPWVIRYSDLFRV